MSRVEDIQTSLWSDPDFKRLSPEAKLIYIWSWTNSDCNMAGLYRADEGEISYRTGLTPRKVVGGLAELEDGRFVFLRDGWLWVRSRVRHLRSPSKSIAKSIHRTVSAMAADHPLRALFISEYTGSWLERALKQESDITELKDAFSLSQAQNTGPPLDPLEGSQGKGKGIGVVVSEAPATSDAKIARELFAYWQQRCNHPKAKPGRDRLAKVKARLAEGYTPEDIRTAIDGAAVGAHVNDDGQRFDDLELICRSGSKLELFMSRATGRRDSGSRGTPTADALRRRQEREAAA